jgi:hypothetical protein
MTTPWPRLSSASKWACATLPLAAHQAKCNREIGLTGQWLHQAMRQIVSALYVGTKARALEVSQRWEAMRRIKKQQTPSRKYLYSAQQC